MVRAFTFLLWFFIAVPFTTNYSHAHEGGHSLEAVNQKVRTSPADAKIEFYKEKIKQNPDDYYNYVKLGEVYIQKGREVGRIAPYNEAEEALNKALELYPEAYASYIYLGQISSYKHDFHRTIDHAKKAIELRPEKSTPYGVLGDAYLELGMYEGADRAYEIMSRLDPGFYSLSRIAQIKELNGDREGAIRAMKKSIELARRQNLPEENLAWSKVMLGSMYLNTGELTTAEEYYKEALLIYKDYYLALEHLAEVNAIRDNFDRAAELYEETLTMNPKPQFYIALGNIYENLGDQERADSLYTKAEKRYEEIIHDGIKGHSRELALFYADNNKNLDHALELSLHDSENTEDIYAYDTLAWVYYKLGELNKAEEAINKSLRLGTEDALLYYHAGMIYYKLGNMEEAKKYLQLVLVTNPNFDKNKTGEVKAVLAEVNE
ncbi:MAG: tetratricopeptide repeat protein [Deltaproteobacteria bacterium]